jgi:hypothetical protein
MNSAADSLRIVVQRRGVRTRACHVQRAVRASTTPLGEYPGKLTERLDQWADSAPRHVIET